MANTLTGIVTSDVRDKTITVSVISRETHPLYRKQFTVTRKYAAHDEKNEAKLGDKVLITESRPISKTKTWKLEKVVEKARGTVKLKEGALEAEVPEKEVKANVKKTEVANEEAAEEESK
ncbi:MAG: 30S ribosomal protein S17 [Candidatus Nomurabacteria bacterium]|jgi:small subunit ribosomal protein S17|nr:30S ribosomal protein S17 [Candidatus Nomurabacteria bacterium]